MAPSQKYLICKGKAGLGNRLLSALGAILYAKLTKRALCIDWSDPGYSRGRENSWGQFFARPTLPEQWTQHVAASTSIAPQIWRGKLQCSVDEIMSEHETDANADMSGAVNAKYSIDFARLDYAEDVLVRWSYFDDIDRLRPHLTGPWASLRASNNEAILRRVIRQELELHPQIRQRVDAFKAAHFSDVTIGLHIRYSDRKNSFAAYPRIVDKLLSRHPDAGIFLATDNKDVEQFFQTRYRAVIVTKKWVPAPGVPIHRTRECPDKLESGIEALVDLYLLGACNFLAYNRTTTFGVMARLLSDAPASAIFETSPPIEAVRNVARFVKRRVAYSLSRPRAMSS